ncbi:MYXO-CTERM sorting domain-containing protein [Pyxidicoccus sp. MSG2]|uniref:MYXO-CTERM sorting domain-containing protein n=1 Tax=Pyxidicoccus sp. MSG2 TaxID=2996790 RepID=UPI002270DA5F|nr:MYXO-CTERM sorting domain-containing protein [Pyxidicoccus sp. MSG2]MCY1016910.1 MYXO-CTERM sorting domain-containing protein [Pyxidicoccus sp. MSG2]
MLTFSALAEVWSATASVVSLIYQLAPEPSPDPEEGGGCSAGPGDSSWLLASLAVLAAAVPRRQLAS